MEKNSFDIQESYLFYSNCKNIDTTRNHFKVRKERMIAAWKAAGLAYPIKRVYSTGHSIFREPKTNKNLKTDYFTNIDCPSKAYFLGLIAADGNVIATKDTKRGNRYDFRLGLKDSDKDLLTHFSQEIGHSLGMKTYSSKIINVTGKKDYTCKPVTTVSVYNKQFVESLITLGIVPNKSRVGIDVSKIPTNFIQHFIRGYFDGDGCIGVYPRKYSMGAICYICSNTIEILQFIKEFLPSNIDCYISKNASMYYLKIRKQSILDFYEFIKDSSLCLKRKELKFEKFRTYVEQSTLANSVNSGKGEIPNPEPSTIEIL